MPISSSIILKPNCSQMTSGDAESTSELKDRLYCTFESKKHGSLPLIIFTFNASLPLRALGISKSTKLFH